MKLSLLKHIPIAEAVHDVTFAEGANRLLVSRSESPMLLLDAKTGKEVAKLPKGAYISAIDAAGTVAAVTEDGKRVGGRYEWGVSLWDLAKGKKIAALAKNNPDDNITPEAIGPTRVMAIRKKKSAYSVCLFDRKGTKVEEVKLGKVPLPFHAALSTDERSVAHAYFTGAAQLVDLASGKGQKLAGGTLRIGRQHDKGIHGIAFDESGEHVFYVSSASNAVHVWSSRTRKSVGGSWVGKSVKEAFFYGSSLVLLWSGSQEATAIVHSLAPKTKPREIVLGKGSMHFASADGNRLLACAGDTGWDAYAKNGLWVFDLATGKCAAKATLPASMKAVNAVGIGAGRVAVGDRKGGIALYALA